MDKAPSEKAPSENAYDNLEGSLASLVSWAHKQRSMKIHPGITIRGTHLVLSLPAEEGTPLIGVTAAGLLSERPAQDRDLDEAMAAAEADCLGLMEEVSCSRAWALKLSLRLIKEACDYDSKWTSYVSSLPRQPASPLTWPKDAIDELQYWPLKRALKVRRKELVSFYDKYLKDKDAPGGAEVDLDQFLAVVATVESRGVDIGGDEERALIPIVDNIGPPEGAEVGGVVPNANCKVVVEGGGLAILYASRNIKKGEVLTRDPDLSPDDLVLRHGLIADGRSDDKVQFRVSLALAKPWHLEVLKECVKIDETASGVPMVRCGVRPGDDVDDVVDGVLSCVARTLSCATKEQLDKDKDPTKSGGISLESLKHDRRIAYLRQLAQLITSAKKTYPTWVDDDTELLEELKSEDDELRRLAVSYRLGKKWILEEGLNIVERALDLEERVGTIKEGGEGDKLPFAVTGASAD